MSNLAAMSNRGYRVPKCDVTKILFLENCNFGLNILKKLLEIASIDKFQLHLRNNDRHIGN